MARRALENPDAMCPASTDSLPPLDPRPGGTDDRAFHQRTAPTGDKVSEPSPSIWRHPVILVFVLAVSSGAALLFVLEPLVGKWVLPTFGGTPAVWNTCLMFFQANLLAGYAWVHFGTRWLGIRRHAIVHGAIVLASLLTLPPRLPEALLAGAADAPIGSLILMLAAAVGAPFFVVTTTAPLVQKWLSTTKYPSASDPYYLYAASNLGSLAGLLAYPFLIEPSIGLAAQRSGWTGAYIGYALLLGVTGLLAWSGQDGAGPKRDTRPRVGAIHNSPVRWAFLAFVPSAMLLAVTAYVTTDIAPVPLLWMLPLSLYLGSFVLAFARPESRWLKVAARVQVPLLLLIGCQLIIERHPFWVLPLHLLLFAITAWVAHGTLARERPGTDRLTIYYLWISLGGALGGVFIVFVTPLLLMPDTEYLLLLALAALARPRTEDGPVRAGRMIVAGATAIGLSFAIRLFASGSTAWVLAVTPVFLVAALAVTRLRSRPAPLCAAFIMTFVALRVVIPGGSQLLAEERNFFGTTSVYTLDGMHYMRHGRTLHGMQHVAPDRRRQPTAYYSEEGPFGDAFALVQQRLPAGRIGVVGLGTGTAACYALPGQAWEFFEINPSVIRFALDTTFFSFIASCAPNAVMRPGDARLRIAEAEGSFDVLVLDAFSSDAVPVHLITREAFDLYVARLQPQGVIVLNITNTYLDLEPVIADHARALGLSGRVRHDTVPPSEDRVSSSWIVLAVEPATIEMLAAGSEWRPLETRPGLRAWTDDYSNLYSILRTPW